MPSFFRKGREVDKKLYFSSDSVILQNLCLTLEPQEYAKKALEAWNTGNLEEARDHAQTLANLGQKLWSFLPLLLLHALSMERPCLFPAEARKNISQEFLDRANLCPTEAIDQSEIALVAMNSMSSALSLHGMLLFLRGKIPEYKRKQLAAGDFVNAHFILALHYINDPQDHNLKEALHKLTLASNKGHATAQVALGKLLMHGNGIEHNSFEAERLYQLSAAQGLAVAQRELAGLYIASGRNILEAIRLLQLAAEQYDPAAQVLLANMYLRAFDVTENASKAKRLLYAAASQGYHDSFFWMGLMHSSGKQCSKDSREAIRLMRFAAALGSPALLVYKGLFSNV